MAAPIKADGPVEALEETFHLLRRAPADAISAYLAGSVPFLLGFLFFWTEMSRARNADAECFAEAFLVALLFIWMNCCKAVFAGRLRRQLEGSPEPPWTWRRASRVLALQSRLQPLKLVAMPLAAGAILPAAVTCAYFRNLTALADKDGLEPDEISREARRQARLWPGQNWAALGILTLLSLVVFLNVALTLAMLPQLVRVFTGYESEFSRSGPSFVLNSTFLAVAVGISWLCLDPVIQAFYVLRCFMGQAVRTGEDLKAQLRALGRVALLFLIAGACLWVPERGFAAAAGAPVPPSPRVAQLDRSIDQVLAKREYQWRLPRAASQGPPFAATLVKFADQAVAQLKRAERFVERWVGRLIRWLRDLFGSPADKGRPRAGPNPWLKFLVLALAALAAGGAVALLLRRNRRRKLPVSAPAHGVIDLNDESLVASQLPEETWLALAEEWIAKQDLRMALRALYLGTLAYLGRCGLVTIHACKSNREYETELRRRARALPAVPPLFRANVSSFEQSWYGRHVVLSRDIEQFRGNFEQIKLAAAGPGGTP